MSGPRRGLGIASQQQALEDLERQRSMMSDREYQMRRQEIMRANGAPGRQMGPNNGYRGEPEPRLQPGAPAQHSRDLPANPWENQQRKRGWRAPDEVRQQQYEPDPKKQMREEPRERRRLIKRQGQFISPFETRS